MIGRQGQGGPFPDIVIGGPLSLPTNKTLGVPRTGAGVEDGSRAAAVGFPVRPTKDRRPRREKNDGIVLRPLLSS